MDIPLEFLKLSNMSFRIVDSFIEGKESRKLCEDRIVIVDSFACIVDGATSKSEMKFGDISQGKHAGIIIDEVFFSIKWVRKRI